MSIYTDILKLVDPKTEIDNYYSDLYVKAHPEVFSVLRANKVRFNRFKHQVTGEMWLEVPLCYDPFWATHCPSKEKTDTTEKEG